MNCEIFLEMIGSYADETLDEERRHWFRHHLGECASCRQSALRREPSLMFATAPETAADPEAVEACAAAVTARIRQDRLASRLRGRRLPWMAAAAAAAMVVSAGVVWRATVGTDNAGLAPLETAQELEPIIAPPTVDVEAMGEEVRVYQFATDGDDTAVYFIVDPALEL